VDDKERNKAVKELLQAGGLGVVLERTADVARDLAFQAAAEHDKGARLSWNQEAKEAEWLRDRWEQDDDELA